MDEQPSHKQEGELFPVFHEISEKFDTPKGRLKRDIFLFVVLVPVGVFLPSSTVQALGSAVFIIFMVRNWSFSIKKKPKKHQTLPENVIRFPNSPKQ